MNDKIRSLLAISIATSLVAVSSSFAEEGSGAASYLMLDNAAVHREAKSSDEKPEDAAKALNEDGDNPREKQAGTVAGKAAKKQTDDSTRKDASRQKPKADDDRTIKAYVAFETASNSVSTRCFPNALKVVLSKVQQRYGTRPIVNSGYRSSGTNRRVGGARQSYHMKCMAADIKVPGVSKHNLARYLKSVSGVGGVGTYACNSFVHVDIGPKRTWNWGCRGRRSGA